MPSGEDREPEYDALLEMLRRAMFLFMPDFAWRRCMYIFCNPSNLYKLSKRSYFWFFQGEKKSSMRPFLKAQPQKYGLKFYTKECRHRYLLESTKGHFWLKVLSCQGNKSELVFSHNVRSAFGRDFFWTFRNLSKIFQTWEYWDIQQTCRFIEVVLCTSSMVFSSQPSSSVTSNPFPVRRPIVKTQQPDPVEHPILNIINIYKHH